MKEPKRVNGTFRHNQSTASTNTSDMGTIEALFVSMYSQMSITKRVLARNMGKKELEKRESKIQFVPLKNL